MGQSLALPFRLHFRQRERKKIKVVYTLIKKAQFEIGDFEFRTVTEEIPILKDDLVLLKSINH